MVAWPRGAKAEHESREDAMKGSSHGTDKTNKARKMALCAKAFAAKPGNWSSISGPT